MTKTKPTHGGRRKGAGRKSPPSPLKVYSVRLTEEQAAFAQMIGGDDRSVGIRDLIDKAMADR